MRATRWRRDASKPNRAGAAAALASVSARMQAAIAAIEIDHRGDAVRLTCSHRGTVGARAGQQGHEFLAAEARQQVGGPRERRPQCRGNGLAQQQPENEAKGNASSRRMDRVQQRVTLDVGGR